ncbi:MAG: AEC family transporter [Pseudomonadota bacterium]
MILQVLDITAPVFLLAAVGYGWARAGLPYDIDFVTRLGVHLATPCLIFATLARGEIDLAATEAIAAATALVWIAMGVILALVLWAAQMRLRTWLAPTLFTNSGNLGLPIAYFAFGDEGLALGIVVFALMVSVQFSLGLWLVAGRSAGWTVLRQPMVWAALAGLAAAIAGLRLPVAIEASISLIGQMAIPLMLLTLGVSVSRIQMGGLWRAALISLARFGVAGGVSVLVGLTLGLTDAAFAVLVLQAIMPAPVTNYLIALQYNAEPDEVAGLVVVSTLLSILLIPLTLALLL